jgi:hypothetical protein
MDSPNPRSQNFEIGRRLNPRDVLGSALGIGASHFFARRFEEAKAALLLALEEAPGWVPPYRFQASCYAQMGQLDEAREIVKRLRAMTPVVVPRAMYWRNPEDRELFLSGLRRLRERRADAELPFRCDRVAPRRLHPRPRTSPPTPAAVGPGGTN